MVDKALALDPKLAEGHMVRGMVRQLFDWDWRGAESDYREAIALNRGYAEAHHELSMLLMRQKRFAEALREGQTALSIEPMSVRFLHGVGEVEAYSGRHAEALAIADQIIGIDSLISGSYYIRGIVFEQAGRLADAEQAARTCVRVAPIGCDWARARLGYIYAATGRRARALQVLDTLNTELRNAKDKSSIESKSFDIAIVQFGLGNRAEAMTWLERAVSEHVMMVYLGLDPAFRSLHDEPRFRALLRKVGLPS
ncbi:MAG: tetratricopeptide repeat protein [Acidobacteria bacterium]|nr:tetratricopeptide repeat protein [Acidobacteriota bacterium]